MNTKAANFFFIVIVRNSSVYSQKKGDVYKKKHIHLKGFSLQTDSNTEMRNNMYQFTL